VGVLQRLKTVAINGCVTRFAAREKFITDVTATDVHLQRFGVVATQIRA